MMVSVVSATVLFALVMVGCYARNLRKRNQELHVQIEEVKQLRAATEVGFLNMFALFLHFSRTVHSVRIKG